MPAETPSLSARDRAVVEFVTRFRQASARQVGELFFADLASRTPLDRCLARLVDRRYLARLSVRLVGGDGGGSAQYVYAPGRAAWRTLDMAGRYWVPRSTSAHTMEITECFVRLKALERSGDVEVIRFDPEREGRRQVDGVQLTPDAYVELGNRRSRTRIHLFLEVDRGTERASVLAEKCRRYWRAYRDASLDPFPFIVFTVPDERRRDEVAGVIAHFPDPAPYLFRVIVQSEIAALVSLADASGVTYGPVMTQHR